jgi:hypothetical protein
MYDSISAEAELTIISKSAGDLKQAAIASNQARIAFLKSAVEYRNALEDLGRQMQICAR